MSGRSFRLDAQLARRMGRGGLLASFLMLACVTLLVLTGRGEPWFATGFFVLGSLLFLASGMWHLKRAVDEKPGLVIDDQGFEHSTAPCTLERVEWSEVREFWFYQDAGARRFIVLLKNPWNAPQKVPFHQRVMVILVTRIWLKSPVVLNPALVGRSIREVHQDLQEGLDAYRAK